MSGKIYVWLLSIILLASPSSSQAQQAKKNPRVGYLSAAPASAVVERIGNFRRGLHELGYDEGKNIVFEFRYADGKLARLSGLATELVALKVDVIVTAGPVVTRAAKQSTATIAIP